MSDIGGAGSTTWATFLRKARKAKGLTQEDLADAAGVSRQTVIRWERGDAGFEPANVVLVARVLGVPVGEALAVASGAEDDIDLPPPLPRELAHLVDIYSDMNDQDRALLLQRVEWINEWAVARLETSRSATPKGRRRTG